MYAPIEGVDVSLNHTPAIFYTDATIKYHMPIGWLGDQDQEFYFTINNLFNQQPPISGGNPTTYSVPVSFAYDIIGRYFTAGVRVSVGMAPILPGISDRPEQLAEAVKAARHAGAHHIWASMLHLRPGTREHFLEALAHDWPSELVRYERLYAGRSYLPQSETAPITEHVRALAREHCSNGRPALRPAPTPTQLTLV